MKFDLFIRRAFEALQISSQNKLTILIEVNRAGITQAKKKGMGIDMLMALVDKEPFLGVNLFSKLFSCFSGNCFKN